MTDSVEVLGMLKMVYTIYCLAAISLMAWFGRGLAAPDGQPRLVKPSTFYGFVGALVFVGVAIHIFTFNQIPWVKIDFKRDNITPDQIVKITAKDHKFILPSERIVAQCNKYILFDVESKDLTYGFGLIRQNGSMVMQMQVVPGSPNQLMWQFGKNGVYSIKSTEYSGPKGVFMEVKNAFEVTGCSENDKYSMLEVK
ncbi:MAG: cytochrome C oxidase subunit II [SAR324 cluster bacterium]|uniref:Cytochrome C oxidase subunit II n=1 Tax=SAR324 cluster bacterium TaxID=2024889 RepID=A0A2A4T2W8_9DELT|nr:MAG: cytochrome C oxidase subunit II [SAR324 cluster bacterium]